MGAAEQPFEVHVLGACELVDGDRTVTLTGVQRRLIARLALTPHETVSVDELAAALWGERPPATARASIQNQVSRLRAHAGADLLQTYPDGYRLCAPTDVEHLRTLVLTAERELGEDPAQALAKAERALGLRGGEPFADLDGAAAVELARAEVEALVDAARDLEVEAALALGLHARALSTAQRVVTHHPHDELRSERLARAYELCGRRGDALAEIARVRRALRTDLGLAAAPQLDLLERRLLARSPVTTAPASAAFFGRRTELDRILEAAHSGRSLLVTGPRGIGVTSVLGHAQRRLHEERSAAAIATTRVLGQGDVAVAPLLDLLDELGVEPSPALGALGAFVPAIETLAASGPVVLIVDDLERAGPSSRRALLQAGRLDGVSLIAGGHAPADDADIDETLALDGLSREDVVALVRERWMAVEDGDDIVDWLMEFTGGHPVHLETALAADGGVAALAGADRAGNPPRLLGAVARERIHALPGAVQRALTVVAVAGDGTPEAVVSRFASHDGIAGALNARLLERASGETIRFSNGALREFVYDDTPAGTRDELHHAIGSLLMSAGAHVDAARHHMACSAIDPTAAIAAARAAAGASTALGAHHDAVTWLEQALACCQRHGRDSEMLALRVELGDALRLAGDPRHITVLREAVAATIAAEDDEMLGEAVFALLQLGGTTVSTELSEEIIDLLDETLARLADPHLQAVVRGAASLAFSMTGRAARGRELFAEAERLARDPRTRIRVLPFAYMALGMPEQLGRREQIADELVALGVSQQEPTAHFEGLQLRYSCLLQRAEGRPLRQTFAQMTELVDRAGDVGRRWALQYIAAAIAHLDGDATRAEALTNEAFRLFSPISESRATAVLFGQLFALRVSEGRVGELAPFLATLVEQQPGVPSWNAAYALSICSEQPELALEYAERALGLIEPDFTWLTGHVVAGRAAALAAARSTQDADQLLGRFEQRLSLHAGLVTWQGTCSQGPVATTLALIARTRGDAQAARAHAAAARELARSLQAPVFLAELDALGL